MMKIEAHIFLCLTLQCVSTQFTSNGIHPKTPCEVRGTALVEQFFNIIFAEFHRSPPTCICVQMCPDQPTYCYPNGCFKKTEKKRETPVSRIQQDGSKTMFLVDNDKDFLLDMIGSGNSASVPITGKPERSLNYYQIGRPSPFKEIVFKYKRLPKLEMKYNLREQVKNTKEKRAEVDVSKTRWPTNKQLNRMPYKINHQRNSNYLTSAFSETNQAETPKYFKRYLTKRENENGLDIGALYLYKDTSNFSLETLIDNLIERGLEGVNSTSGSKISKSNKFEEEDNNRDSKFMKSVTEVLIEDTTRSANASKAKQNYSIEKIYVANSTAAYFEMMTTLSNEIEKQNIASMKTIQHLNANVEKNISRILNFTLINNTTTNTVGKNKSHRLVTRPEERIECSTNKAPIFFQKEVIPNINANIKKSKQRIVRKLQNRKLN